MAERELMTLEQIEQADRVVSMMDSAVLPEAIPPLSWAGVLNLIYTARMFREWIEQLGMQGHPRDLCQRWRAGRGYGSPDYVYDGDIPCTCGLDRLLAASRPSVGPGGSE